MRHHSLRGRLTAITLTILLITAIIASVMAFTTSLDESSELVEEHLYGVAVALAEMDTRPQSYHPIGTDDGLWVDVVLDDHTLNTVPLGFSTSIIDGERFTIYHLKENGKNIIVRQRADTQDDLAMLSALGSLIPLLIVSGILLIALPLVFWYNFRGVRRAAWAVQSRAASDLSALTLDDFPAEILPFAHAMNGLLAKADKDMAAQKRFIADASHELRSPLTAISLQVQRLQGQNDIDKIHAGLDKLAHSVAKNRRLVDELLTLARLNAGTHSRQNINLSARIKDTVSELLPIISAKGLTLEMHDDADIMLAIDPTALTVLIKNLLQNAIHHSPKNGQIRISTLRTLPPIDQIGTPIISHTHQSTTAGVLQIADGGHGISPDDYHKVFEPFVRLSDTTSDTSDTAGSQYGGTGLGLPLVRSVCEQAGITLYLHRASLGGLLVTLVF